jgi:tRNA(fMet)-specific endonuclease VapC
MTPLVCDTDVWSFLFKQDSRAEPYRPYLQNHVLCVSFQTVAELYQWADKSSWGTARRQRLEKWLLRFYVLTYDVQTAKIWGQIRVDRERIGLPLAAQDAWIAACALRHNYPLATHNVNDYVNIPNLTLIHKT